MFERFKNTKVITDEKIIDLILDRYTAEILPSRDEFKKELMSGRRLRFYNGADPTGPDLHLGHSVSLLLLEEFRKLGHETIILFGDFTATLGDPTDKSATRKKLSKEEVEENIKTWKDQVGKIVDFNGKNSPKVLRNSAWFSKMKIGDSIELASNFTVQQMIERDMFQKRINEGKPIYFNEFFYPLLQGYDSVAMDVDVEIGGTDQTFNMLTGRTLQERLNNKNKFVVTIPLIEDSKTGKKMSKSEGNYVAIGSLPNDMFGNVMSLSDGMIVSLLQYTTKADLEKIEEIKKRFESGENPKVLKEEVAFEVVKTYHGDKKAEKAKQHFDSLFTKKEVTDDIKEIVVDKGRELSNVLIEYSFVNSKSEFVRLVNSGAVSEFEGEKLSDIRFKVEKDTVFKIGKKKVVKILVK